MALVVRGGHRGADGRDIGGDGLRPGSRTLIVVYCCGASLLQIPLAARMRVRLHRSRSTFRVNWPLAALLLTVAAVYVLARMALGAAGAPLPSTLAGLLMSGAYAAGLPLAQQMTARRLLAAR
jgi:hypothetical protein